MENLRQRALIIQQIRAFFDLRGFTEVTTPVLIAAPAPEPHIDCPSCGSGYLRASPELQMKKLLAAGMDRIYQLGPCFREGEFGARHHPEFTMIEWYRKNATYHDIKADLEELLSNLSLTRTTTTISVRDAYLCYAGWDPWAGEWDQDRFDYDMATKIEPAIASHGGGVFLMDYPPEAASLAKLSASAAPPCAERWEFYWDGVELANCFTELCDREEQSRRFIAAKAERQRLGESEYPLDNEFLEMLPLIGSAAGVALGIDRLVALICGESDIHAVMTTE